jgi:hypothetical protein
MLQEDEDRPIERRDRRRCACSLEIASYFG